MCPNLGDLPLVIARNVFRGLMGLNRKYPQRKWGIKAQQPVRITNSLNFIKTMGWLVNLSTEKTCNYCNAVLKLRRY